jgi:isopentenyl-diphosphate delta-isomerase
VVQVYVADAPSGLQITPNPDEVMATRWVDFYDLSADVARHPDQYTPWLRIYLQDHQAAIFGDLMRAV